VFDFCNITCSCSHFFIVPVAYYTGLEKPMLFRTKYTGFLKILMA